MDHDLQIGDGCLCSDQTAPHNGVAPEIVIPHLVCVIANGPPVRNVSRVPIEMLPINQPGEPRK
jgi:hypothetical protein